MRRRKAKAKKYTGDWNLKERIQDLPKSVYDELRQEFESYSAVSTGRKRWYQMQRGELEKFFAYELAVVCEHVGCTIFELIDPDADLLDIYLQKRKAEEAEVAIQLGLAKPKK